MMRPCKCFPHVSKMRTLTYNWANNTIIKKTNTRNSLCHLCNDNIEGEFHYLFICKYPYLSKLRKKLIPEYYTNYPKDNHHFAMFKYNMYLVFFNKNKLVNIL